MSYTHLSQYERYQTQHLHRGGSSSRAIGKQIERSPSINRGELQRNAAEAAYEARQAQPVVVRFDTAHLAAGCAYRLSACGSRAYGAATAAAL